jgi:hypothetical protein
LEVAQIGTPSTPCHQDKVQYRRRARGAQAGFFLRNSTLIRSADELDGPMSS